MSTEEQKPKPLPRKSSGADIKDIDDLSSRVQDLERKASVLKTDIERMERRSDSSTNFVMVLVVGIAIVFLVALIPISLDYFRNNYQRHKEYTGQIQGIEESFLQKYYTKEQLDQYRKDGDDAIKVIRCIRNKGFFSMNCF